MRSQDLASSSHSLLLSINAALDNSKLAHYLFAIGSCSDVRYQAQLDAIGSAHTAGTATAAEVFKVEVQRMFRRLDQDGDNFITIEEMKVVRFCSILLSEHVVDASKGTSHQ